MVRRITLLMVLCFAAYGCRTMSTPQQKTEVLHGVASWYGQEFAGRTTANGEIFDPMLFTAAHRSLPFGTIADVRNPATGQTVRVRINDRGPYVGNRLIDLSYAAAQRISLIQPGSGPVDIAVVKLGAGEREPPAPYVVAIADARSQPAPAVPATTTTTEPELPPNIAFPFPDAVTQAISGRENDFRVEVADERKQVAADGRTIETVRVAEAAPVPIPIVEEPPAELPQAILPPAEPAPTPPRTVSPAPTMAQSLDIARAREPRPATSPAPRRATRTVPSAPARVATTGRYVVQVGAFTLEQNAKQLQDQLTKIGQQSYIEHENLYRVRLGPFASRDLAVKARTTLESRGISAIVVAEP